MAYPIRLKKTLLLPLLISLLASPLAIFAADNSGWDCHRDKVSGEWLCVVEKPKPAAPISHKEIPPEKPLESAASQRPPEEQPPQKGIASRKPEPTPPVQVTKPLIPQQPGWACTTSEARGWDCTLHGTDVAEKPVAAQPQPVQDKKLPSSSPVIAAAATTQKPMPGWACEADEKNSGWDCKLTGLDPQGKMHLPRPLDKASSHPEQLAGYDEFLFQNMLKVIPQDPWGNCRTALGGPVIYRAEETRALRQQSPAYIESDFSEAFENDEVVVFSGNVDYKRADQILRSDRLTHDQFANTISAQGNVIYREEGMTFQSEKSFMWLDSDRGKLHNSKFIFETVPARGSSKLTTLDSKTLTRHHGITYTTCRPGNQDWELEAKKLTLDQTTGVGSANNVWVHFKNIPLFYAPRITFPIDDRRKSGFLMPTFGSGEEMGFDLATPYYWNIAPNYDATITPRYLSKRGFLFGAEFRHLNKNSEGIIAAEYIAEDKETQKPRGQLRWDNETRFSKNLTGSLDINLTSDDDYLDDFGNSLSLNDNIHLLNRAELSYRGRGWSLLGRVDGYQTIERNISTANQPYRRLPQLLFNMNQQSGPAGSRLNLQTEFVYFDQGDTVTGKRLNIRPEISFPMRTAASFLTPTLALQSTQYWLDDQPNGNSDSINRTLPILSVDGGLFFEREFQFDKSDWQQTLEPRLFYLFIPDEDQDEIPIFDTGEYDFNFNQLFRTNRFNGADRLNDANQLTAALTTRFIESETGRERLRASIGQIFYFKDREVTLPGKTALTESSSDLVTELDAILNDHWTLRTGYQWNPHEGDSRRASASIRYRNGADRLFNLAYQFREENLDQTDLSLRWPIADSWHGVARWNYSLRDEIILDSFLGIEKESCCWRFKVLVRHSVDDVNSEPETAFFFQLELKGLTSFGQKLDAMLSNEIPGYQLPGRR